MGDSLGSRMILLGRDGRGTGRKLNYIKDYFGLQSDTEALRLSVHRMFIHLKNLETVKDKKE